MRLTHLSLSLALSLPLASSALAETLQGRLLDPAGNPVVGANLDLEDANGDDVTLSNDGTNALGFFSTDLPGPGTYRVIFNPPPSHPQTLAVVVLEDVQISGITDLGDVVIDFGAFLSGLVEDSSGTPVEAVDLDLVDAQGVKREVGTDSTDSAGEFEILVPLGEVELRFDPSGAMTPGLAPRAFDLTVVGDLDLGTIVLPAGYSVFAVVRRPNGTGVQGADLDAVDVMTGAKQYTPGDNTDNNGFVDITLAAGTYDIEICAPLGDRLVTTVVSNVAISGTTNLGVITLQAGVLLSGTVTDTQGFPLAGVDLDVNVAGTQVSVPTCMDDTNAAGQYAVVLPPGSYDVEFMDVAKGCSGPLVVNNVSVGSDTTLDVTLPSGVGTAYCSPANVNSTGAPAVLTAVGSCTASQNNMTLQVTQLPTNQFAYFLNSQTQGFIGNPGGSQGDLCLTGNIGRYNGQLFSSGSTGTGSLQLDLTQTPTANGPVSVLAGQTWNFQCWYRDANPTPTSNFTSALSVPFN